MGRRMRRAGDRRKNRYVKKMYCEDCSIRVPVDRRLCVECAIARAERQNKVAELKDLKKIERARTLINSIGEEGSSPEFVALNFILLKVIDNFVVLRKGGNIDIKATSGTVISAIAGYAMHLEGCNKLKTSKRIGLSRGTLLNGIKAMYSNQEVVGLLENMGLGYYTPHKGE